MSGNTNNKVFFGKKLLILAANAESISIVKRAKELGIYTIVTDHIAGSPAKAYADKSYDINGTDIESVIQMAKVEKIDGILVGVADPLVPSYVKIAERLQLPGYISSVNVDYFTDKKCFKHALLQHGLHAIDEFSDMNNVEYPCVVKPIRGRGGKGVTLCYNFAELKEAVEVAKANSDNMEIVIEKFMRCNDIIVDYFVCNGTTHLIGIGDRRTLNTNTSISPVTYGTVYPSEVSDLFIEKCHDKFIRLFQNLNIRDGIFEMQVFVDGQEFYPYDIACHLTGESSGAIFPEVYGINLIDALITYALTGKMGSVESILNSSNMSSRKAAQSIWILLSPGKIANISGIEDIKAQKGVLSCLQRLKKGDEVTDKIFQTEKSTFARLWVCADSRQELKKIESSIRKRIIVKDTQGNSMVWEGEN